MNYSSVVICIPTYNAAITVLETLGSIQGQTYANVKVNIIDNVSVDNTRELVSDFSNKINLIINDRNLGGEASFEKCLHWGDGDYKAIYHADDVYEDDIVKKQVDFLEANKNCGVVLTRANFINDKGDIIGCSKTFKQLAINPEVGFLIFDVIFLIKKLMRYGNFLITPSAMFRDGVAKNKIKNWNATDFGTSADLDIWLRAAETVGLGVLEEPLINYRLSYLQGSYHYNKVRVESSDFLKVMNHWVEKETIKSGLDEIDFYYYQGLKKMDRLLCGIRAYLNGKDEIAHQLLKGTFHGSYFKRFRIRYLALWLLTGGLRFKLTRSLFKPLFSKILSKKYVG